MEAGVFRPAGIAFEFFAYGNNLVFIRFDGGEVTARDTPLVKSDEGDVAQFRLIKLPQFLQCPGANGSGASKAVLFAGSISRRFVGFEHVKVEFVGRAGADGTAGVDEQLLEVPIAGSDFGQLGLPETVGSGGKAGDDSTTGEGRFGANGGLIDDGVFFGTAILGSEDKRLTHGVRSVSDDDRHRFFYFAVRFALTNRVTGAVQGRCGTIRPGSIWLG